MHSDERVEEELEALQAILMDEILIKTDDRGTAVAVETTVYPWTALDTQQQYVRVDLSVTLPSRYPDVSPTVTLRNPRGLDDSVLTAIEAQIREKCEDFISQPVIYEIINLVKEQLTTSNVPCCQCCICLYGFRQGDHFTKTPCYHYFHSHCLAKHLRISRRIFNEEQDMLPAWQRTDSFQATCPVCRAPVSYDVETLDSAPPPLDVLQADNFKPSPELRRLQQQMAALYVRQQQRGGIIQPDNSVILLTEDSGNAGDNR
ncbi:E3 ubiquitin-protein ligase RNF25 isoform X2 [Macrosteles quadrilineatus]|uniref:E3 ubiquitin-protein ligase RNF25 isoform X2 n=1 Tax=Macrosteles quadrilineatus TaxID=74068 RepID=UPI0023E2D784|nr:E3 ubiquitin-protein ligase RNF25 isoform X2 [Macrosteles quadrilineatus]